MAGQTGFVYGADGVTLLTGERHAHDHGGRGEPSATT